MFREARCLAWIAMALLLAVMPAWGHAGYWNEITAIIFLPDGKTMIASCLDDKLHVYDVASGKERSAIDAHKEGVWAAALSADGKWLATVGGDKLIKLWDAATLKEIRKFEGHTKEVLAVAFSPDGLTLVTGGADRTIRTWDVATGKEKKSWHGHELKVVSIAFSPDGKMLASGGICTVSIPGLIQGGTHADEIRLWDAETGKEIRQHTQRGTTVLFTPDGRALAAAGYSVIGTPQDEGNPIVSRGTKAFLGPLMKDQEWLAMKGAGGTLTLSPDGRLLALAYGSRLHLTKGGGKFRGYESEAESLKISIWETASGKEIMQVPDDGAVCIAFSPDGKKLAAGSSSGQVQFHDLAPEGWPQEGKKDLPSAAEMDKLWADLGQEAATPAYAAIWTMSTAGKQAVTYLKGKLQPVAPAGDKAKELLAKLDSDTYAVREAAFRDLKKLGPAIETDLRQAAANDKTSKEVRKRVQTLLDGMDKRPASPEELRQVRALQVLERIGTSEARAVLAHVAEGAQGAWLTEEARRAAKRVETR